MQIIKLITSLFTVVFIALLLYIPAYFYYSHQKENELERYFNDSKAHESVRFSLIQNTYELISQNVYDNIINTDRITSIIKKANTTYDPSTTAALREELYNELLPLYKNLKKQNISELNFQLQGSVSFLRFSNPDKFGDSLIGMRPSIDKVNRTKQPVHGFEEGTTFNGFRNIFPLLHKDRLIGTVEISYSFNALKYEAMKSSAAYYAFILKKDLVDAKVSANEKSHYIPSPLSAKYLQDDQPSDNRAPYKLNQELIESINQNIAEEAAAKLEKGSEFLLHTKVGTRYFISTFVPISNIENKQVAYYISYQQELAIAQIEDSYRLHLLISAIVSLFFSILLVLYFLSQQKAAKRLKLLSTSDPLTKIANRNKFSLIMYSSMQMALRYDLPLSLLIFNIDHFKKINDRLGSDTGDDVLVELSSLAEQHIRLSDLIARWGGDEFIILLPETTHHNAYILAEKLRKVIHEHTFVVTTNLTCSFGVTQLHKSDDEISILKRLDSALRSAKERGRDRVVELP